MDEMAKDICALLDDLLDCPKKCPIHEVCNDTYMCGDPEIFVDELKKKYCQ